MIIVAVSSVVFVMFIVASCAFWRSLIILCLKLFGCSAGVLMRLVLW